MSLTDHFFLISLIRLNNACLGMTPITQPHIDLLNEVSLSFPCWFRTWGNVIIDEVLQQNRNVIIFEREVDKTLQQNKITFERYLTCSVFLKVLRLLRTCNTSFRGRSGHENAGPRNTHGNGEKYGGSSPGSVMSCNLFWYRHVDHHLFGIFPMVQERHLVSDLTLQERRRGYAWLATAFGHQTMGQAMGYTGPTICRTFDALWPSKNSSLHANMESEYFGRLLDDLVSYEAELKDRVIFVNYEKLINKKNNRPDELDDVLTTLNTQIAEVAYLRVGAEIRVGLTNARIAYFPIARHLRNEIRAANHRDFLVGKGVLDRLLASLMLVEEDTIYPDAATEVQMRAERTAEILNEAAEAGREAMQAEKVARQTAERLARESEQDRRWVLRRVRQNEERRELELELARELELGAQLVAAREEARWLDLQTQFVAGELDLEVQLATGITPVARRSKSCPRTVMPTGINMENVPND